MKLKILIRLLTAAALLLLAAPLAASAQVYNRDRYANRDQYDQIDRRAAREAMNGLENSSARLENDLNYAPGQRVSGILQLRTVDNNAIAQVRDFRRAVRMLKTSSDNGRNANHSVDEARMVLDRGVQVDRYLRVRTGSSRVDEDLSELRSSLHILADAYGLTVPY